MPANPVMCTRMDASHAARKTRPPRRVEADRPICLAEKDAVSVGSLVFDKPIERS